MWLVRAWVCITCGDPVLSNRVFYVCTVIVGALNVGIAFYEVGF